tara:strand:+ start:93 stop:263 length:171 start_codon:yes stop_codon:yes gene_type:complete
MKLPDGSAFKTIRSLETSNRFFRAGGRLFNWDFSSAKSASNNWADVGAVRTVFWGY